MKRRIKGRKICIICEGFEEIDYLNALINKAVFSNKYEFVLINSKSINNISSIYSIFLSLIQLVKSHSKYYKE